MRLALVAVGLALMRRGWRRSTIVEESHAGPGSRQGPSSNLMSSLPSLIKSSLISGRVTPRPRGGHCHIPGRSRGSRNYSLGPLPHWWPYGPEQLFSLSSKAFYIFSNPTTFSSIFGKEEKKKPFLDLVTVFTWICEQTKTGTWGSKLFPFLSFFFKKKDVTCNLHVIV